MHYEKIMKSQVIHKVFIDIVEVGAMAGECGESEEVGGR